MHYLNRWICISFVWLLMLCTASAVEKKISITDFSGRGFAPDLVQYRLELKDGQSDSLQLNNGESTALPIQLSKDADGNSLLSFVAEVPPNAAVDYTLTTEAGTPASGGLKTNQTDDSVCVENQLLAVKFPPIQNQTFSTPVAAKTLPAPITAFKSGKSDWLGKSGIRTERLVKSFSVKLAESGPVYTRIVYEIQWQEGGYYRATMTVIDRVPTVKITEEFDLQKLDGSDIWYLQLASGWQPDTMETARTYANGGGVDRGSDKPLKKLEEMKNPRISPDNISFSLSYIGIFNAAARKADPANYTMAGCVPLHKGSWRKMNVIPVRSGGPDDVRLLLSMSARNANWWDDSTSETSPFSMQEHDPGKPKTYGRRLWGLVLAKPTVKDAAKSTVRYSYFTNPQKLSVLGPFAQIRSFYGTVGLDRYKDFVLKWPDKQNVLPRLYATAKTAAVSDDKFQRFMKQLKGLCNAPISCPTISHHLTVGTYVTAGYADALLANKDLPAKTRQELRSRLALVMYLYEEPDFISYGSGAHTGNPNMGTSRYSGMCAFLPLLQDHPMFAKWRKHVAGYAGYKMSTQIAPGGAYVEFGSSYHMHGYSRTTNSLPGLVAAKAENIKQLYQAYHKPDWDYFMNLLTPVDPRYGCRMIPGLANAGPGQVGHFLEAAGSFIGIDPTFASELYWAWQNNGKAKAENPWIIPESLKPKKPVLKSRVFPGFGLVFRAHQGTDETYMLLRSGFDWSHWYIDQGHMVVMSRGSVILPYQPYAYWGADGMKEKKADFDYYNVLRFGHPDNEFPYGWPDGNVLDYSFAESVDYAWVSTGMPDWFITPSINPLLQKKLPPEVTSGMKRKLDDRFKQKEGAFDWDRQILFIKGKTADAPNYFIIRDSMPGKGKLASYLNLNLLGTQKNVVVKNNCIQIDNQWPVKADLLFPGRKDLKPDFYEEKQKLDTHHAGNRPAGKVRDWILPKPNPKAKRRGKLKSFEQRVILRVASKPGEDYTWLIYPRKETEKRPEVTALAPGVVKVSLPNGTDYAFLSSERITYQDDDVVFSGKAGTIRIHEDKKVTLSMTGGAGEIGYQGRIYHAVAPFEKTIVPADLAPGKYNLPQKPSGIAMPDSLQNGNELNPGIITKETNGKKQYLIRGIGSPLIYHQNGMEIEAYNAFIEVGKDSIRFVTPDTTYVKLAVGNQGIRGLGPFDLTFTGSGITGKVDGKMRTLVTTWPEKISRPMFHLDSMRYFAGWADDHCIGKGTKAPQFAIAFGVLGGPHSVNISEWTYPELPPKPPEKSLTLN